MNGVFVAGTDTGVGKTLVTVALIKALRGQQRLAVGMKPVAAGLIHTDSGMISDDAYQIAAACGLLTSLALVNPCGLPAPTSPHIAAKMASISINIAEIATKAVELSRLGDFLVVEGAGGWRTPISEEATMAEVAMALGLPVVLVVGLKLGALSHALLTVESIRNCGVPFAGWIANSTDVGFEWREAYVESLTQRLGSAPLAQLPQGCSGDDAAAMLATAARRLAHRRGFPPSVLTG